MPRLEEPSQPHVLIVGGYLTEPINYWPLRRRLLARGAAGVSICPVHLPDWVAAAFAGFGPLLVRTGLAVRRAQRHRRWSAGHRHRPLGRWGPCPSGHVTRALSRTARGSGGRRGRAGDARHAAPACTSADTPRTRRRGGRVVPRPDDAGGVLRSTHRLPDHRVGPGRARADASGSPSLGPCSWLAVPCASSGPTPHEGGDGIVPVTTVHLAGARQLTYHDVRHGHVGGPWYADDVVVDRWWPTALELWRERIS